MKKGLFFLFSLFFLFPRFSSSVFAQPLNEACEAEEINPIICCPLEEEWKEKGILEEMLNFVGKSLKISISGFFSIEGLEIAQENEMMADYFFGSPEKKVGLLWPGAEREEGFSPGVLYRLSPPYLGPKKEERGTPAWWEIRSEQTEEKIQGATQDLNPLSLSSEKLRNALVALPKKKENKKESGRLAPNDLKQEKVLGETKEAGEQGEFRERATLAHGQAGVVGMCRSPLPSEEKKPVCGLAKLEVPLRADIIWETLKDLLSGEELKLFPAFSDLDRIGRYTTGIEIEEGEVFEDSHYEDGGFLSLFKFPYKEYEDLPLAGKVLEPKMQIEISLGDVKLSRDFDLPLDEELKIRYLGSPYLALHQKGEVLSKLMPPGLGEGIDLSPFSDDYFDRAPDFSEGKDSSGWCLADVQMSATSENTPTVEEIVKRLPQLEGKEDYLRKILAESQKKNINPSLIIAIWGQESSFSLDHEGSHGDVTTPERKRYYGHDEFGCLKESSAKSWEGQLNCATNTVRHHLSQAKANKFTYVMEKYTPTRQGENDPRRANFWFFYTKLIPSGSAARFACQ